MSGSCVSEVQRQGVVIVVTLICIIMLASPLVFSQANVTTVCYFRAASAKQNGAAVDFYMEKVMEGRNHFPNQSHGSSVLIKPVSANGDLNVSKIMETHKECQMIVMTAPSCRNAADVVASSIMMTPLLLVTYDPCDDDLIPGVDACDNSNNKNTTNSSSSHSRRGGYSLSSRPLSRASAVVSLAPWLSHWTSAVCDVVSTLGWTEVGVVVDRTLPKPYLKELISRLMRVHIGSVSRKITNSSRDAVVSLMASVDAAVIRKFILCTNAINSRLVLSVVNDRQLHSFDYQALVACPGAGLADVTNALEQGIRLMVMTYRPTPHEDIGINPANMEFPPDPCQVLFSHLQIATHQVLSGIHSLLKTSAIASSCNSSEPVPPVHGQNESDTEMATNATSIPPALQQYQQPAGELNVCGSREWSWPDTQLTLVAVWRPPSRLPREEQPLAILHPEAMAKHFTKFSNRKLIVTTLEAPPFVNVSTEGNNVSYVGLCIDILNAIAATLNFTYEITFPPDNKYGAPDINSSWNGMVGMVKRREADLAIGPITITSVRETVVDFTVPYMEDGGGILSRKGDPEPDLMRIFSPFSGYIWMAIGGMVVVFGLALFVLNKYNPNLRKQRAGKEREGQQQNPYDHSWNVSMSIWTVFGSIMEQGAVKQPKRTSTRVVLGCWWIFTIIIMSIYTATLAAMLTVVQQPGLIDSIEQVASSGLTPITVVGTSWETLFKTAESGVYRKIWQEMQNGPEVQSTQQALDYVRSGRGVFLYDVGQVHYFYMQDCHTLHEAKHVFNANGLGFVLPQNAPYKHAFNRVILKLQEGGFVLKWRKRWWKGDEVCSQQNQGSSLGHGQQMSANSIRGIFFLYGVFVLLASLALVMQWLHRVRIPERVAACLRACCHTRRDQ